MADFSLKELFPFWKTAGPKTRIAIVIAVLVVVAIIWKPWKKDQPSLPQTATATGTNNAVNQAGGNLTISNSSAVGTTSATSAGNNSPIFNFSGGTNAYGAGGILNNANVSANSGSNSAVFTGTFGAPVTSVIYDNSYYQPVSNSVTRDAFESLQGVVSNATDKITLTSHQVELLAESLRDLDQRTSGLEKLPDGRTKIGSLVAGSPTVILDNVNSGIRSVGSNNFEAALTYFQIAIRAFESTASVALSMQVGDQLRPQGQGQLYAMACGCAMHLTNNNLALDFSEKAFKADPKPVYKCLITAALGNLSIQKAREHDFAGAYVLIQRAITNYESIKLPAKTMWLPTMQVAQLYRQASAFAAMTGKIDEAQNYAKKAQEVILK